MKDGGRIINTGSTNAERMPFAGGAVYAMSESALQGLVQGAARDLGPRGITIDKGEPGPVNTELNPDSSDFAEMLKEGNAIPRYASVKETAGIVAYLSSPEAAYARVIPYDRRRFERQYPPPQWARSVKERESWPSLNISVFAAFPLRSVQHQREELCPWSKSGEEN